MTRQPPKPESRPTPSGFAPFGDDLPSDPTLKVPSGSRPSGAPRSVPPTKPGGRTRLAIRALRVTALVGFCSVLLGGAATLLWLRDLGVFSIDKSVFDVIAHIKPADNSLVFDRDGQKVGEFFNNYQVHVPLEKMPKHMIDAILAIEDRSFYTHDGFDPRGIARAAFSRFKGSSSNQGASTITQQVVRNFLLPKERTAQRKIQEIAYAYNLEKYVSKDQILEIYANALFLGNGSYGVGAAALRYFGKPAEELAPHESALIAGLFQSPSRYNPSRYPKRAKARQMQVIKAMYQAKMISFAKAKEISKVPLVYKEYRPLNTEFAPYFIDYVRDQAKMLLGDKKNSVDGQGLRIYTTLDTKLQRLAEEGVADSAKLLKDAETRMANVRTASGKPKKASLETAILTSDPRTGEILAMVGGRDYARSKFNRTWQSMRSPGSSFKPVVYSLALQKKWKWSDVIFVSPITINNYRPHTPNEDFLTETTVFRAFYRSMNTPTVELGQKLGLKSVIEQAKRLGIRSPIKEEFGSLLGSSEVNMFDLTRMYGAFANQGTLVEPIAVTKITDATGKVLYQAPKIKDRSSQAVSPQIAFLMTQGMKAVLSMGTGYTSAHLSNVAAGKTGTSNDAADNWFAGYTANLVSIVWVGTDEHVPIHGDVTGAKLALPIWDRYVSKTLAVRPPERFPAPSGIVTTVVHPKFGNRSPAGVRMYFLRGNEPPAEASALEVLSQSEGAGYRDVFTH